MLSDAQEVLIPSLVPENTESHLTSTNHVNELSDVITTQDSSATEKNLKDTVMFPPMCNSTEFIKHVVQILKNRHWRRLWTTFFIIILLILLIIVFFKWLTDDSVALPIAIIMIVITVFLTIGLLVACCYHSSVGKHYLKLIDNVQNTLQLTDDIWHKQVDALRTVPFVFIGCFNNYKYQRLKNRLYGNIILAEKGILIDELFLIDYGAIHVADITPVVSTTGSAILRMHLITRVYAVGTCQKGRPEDFNLDLFMPPNLQAQELFNICQKIIFYSRTCPVNFFYY